MPVCFWLTELLGNVLFTRQRTVYRLTLVKAWNVEEMQAYSELISLGQPDFIEVKVGFISI
ncbi:S-adenosyl-L-methionine-dependent tRNA 4-demethylwyosine synthase [Dissostichus eleginoides]|nr:S-adenosyl-L-methionine-dependent tRNA 4-demethylwyosine synthase [Dissostichus eleginoides]